MTEEEQILRVCSAFQLRGEYRSYETITYGHINMTYKVYFYRDGEIKDYILQRLNTYVFKNPVEVMENTIAVTEYIRKKIKETGVSAKRYVLHYQKTSEGEYYTRTEDGGFWRCSRFIDDSVSFLRAETPEVMEEAGRAFGEFQLYLSDFPVEKLHIAIPHFHNTVMRYETFRESIRADACGRVKDVLPEIDKCLEFEETATAMYKMQRRGELPLRVTHNDTKCSNILFDKDSLRHLSVVDLDTVMPGLVGFDFGDAIRAGANTADEDERDIKKVSVDMEKFEAFTRGFIGAVRGSLTANEKKSMALGALTMTVECGMRFLTDYLDGDKYFHIYHPDHNFVRARCQFALADDMIGKMDEMNEIVRKYCEE